MSARRRAVAHPFRTRRLTVLVVVATALLGSQAQAQRKAPEGFKVLILTGGQREHHGYREQTQYLQRVLEQTGKVEVTICEEADVLRTEAMAKYDCIVMNADRRDPEHRLTEQQQAALLELVSGGTGFVSIHGFCCAARDWKPEMRQLLGGVLAHFGRPDTKVRHGHYRITIAKPDHPIVKDVNDFEIDDELYYYLQTEGELDPLATAEFEGGNWPVAWTRRFGKGRVFVTPLGHKGWKPESPDPQQHPAFGRILVQGILWTCGDQPVDVSE
jgi:type 1 glutamine amidotransferase